MLWWEEHFGNKLLSPVAAAAGVPAGVAKAVTTGASSSTGTTGTVVRPLKKKAKKGRSASAGR